MPARRFVVSLRQAGARQAVIGAGASAVPDMFPHDPDPDPRLIAEKYDDAQEHDRDRFTLHQESEPVGADRFEPVLPPMSHLIHLARMTSARMAPPVADDGSTKGVPAQS